MAMGSLVTLCLTITVLLAVVTISDGLRRDRQHVLDPDKESNNPILTLMALQKDQNDSVARVNPTPKPDRYEEEENLPRGRIQVLSSNREPSCLSRSDRGDAKQKGLYFLVVKPCEYDDDQFFVYRRDTQQLMMADRKPSKAHRFVATQAFNSKILGYEGRFPLVLEDDQHGNFYSFWSLSWTDFGMFTITTESEDSQVCLEVSDAGAETKVFGRYMDNPQDSALCAAFKLMLPEDDYVAGTIRVFNNTATNSDTKLCVTHREAERPDSVLYVAPCDPADADQRFVYNMVTNHLRTANGVAKPEPFPYDGPGLFFWWKGRIKDYPDLDAVVNKGYGWLLPLRRPGAVYAWDDRGFSGKCWTRQADDSIAAEQTCDSFGFYPEKDNFFTRRRGPRTERRYTSVFVTVPGTKECLTMSRVPIKPNDLSKGWLLRAYLSTCKMDSLGMHQRWVISQVQDAQCTDKSCLGLLRWSGDVFNSLVVPQAWYNYNFTSDRYLTITTDREDRVPFEFDFPFQRDTPSVIKNVATSTPYSNPMCWTVSQQRFVVLGTENCLKFNLVPPNKYGPNPTKGETVVARFDMKSLMIMPTDTSRSNTNHYHAVYQQAAHSNMIDDGLKAKFERYFDVFYPDLGDFGNRRFRLHSGSTFDVRPTGELIIRGGMVLPMLPCSQISRSPYTLMETFFRFFRIDVDRSGAFLIMSNARASGCIVYATFAGHIGLKCYTNYEVVAQGHLMAWDKPGVYNIIASEIHRISLALSTQRGGKATLFLGARPIISVPYVWSPSDSSPNLYLLHDPAFWQYPYPYIAKLPRSAGVWMAHASVYAVPSFDRVRELVHNHWNEKQVWIDQKLPIIHAPTNLTTTWSDCKFYRNKKTKMLYAMSCKVVPSQRVPADVLSLSCSRPKCSVQFIKPAWMDMPSKLPVRGAYEFVYKPNFPSSFSSESVGPRRDLTDPSFVSDGYQTRMVSFDLGFVQDYSDSKLQTDATVMDLFRYRCKESRNPRLQDILADIQDTDGDIF